MTALYAPGATSLRVWLHRRRGVQIGAETFISTDVLLETSRPELISIGRGVVIGIRAVIIAHFRGSAPLRSETGRNPGFPFVSRTRHSLGQASSCFQG